MSLSNGTLYNDNPNQRVSFDPSQTNFMQDATDINTALLALDLAITNFDEGTEIAFDNSGTDLSATTVEGAIKEHNPRIQALEAEYSNTTINSAADIKTELFGLADTNNLTDALQTQIGTNQTDIMTLETNYANSTITSAGQIKSEYESNADTNAFTDALLSKVNGIEAGATADQTGAEIKALYEVEANAFTDTLFTKLSGIENNAKDDQDATEVPFTTTTDLVATNVRDAIEEVYANTPGGSYAFGGWSRQVVDMRLDLGYAGITGTSGTLDSNLDGGLGTAAAADYVTEGTLGSWNRGTFTCDSDGTYHFIWNADQTTNGSTLTHHYIVKKNDTTDLYSEQFVTSSARVGCNNFDVYVDLVSGDFINIHLGANHTATLLAETMYYNVEKIVTLPDQGVMETQQVYYDNANLKLYFGTTDATQGSATTDPKSLYLLDPNFKLDLTEGKWLICYQMNTAAAGHAMYLSGTLTQNIATIAANQLQKSYNGGIDLFTGSIVVNVTTPTSYTIWHYPPTSSNGLIYEASAYSTDSDPDSLPTLTAVRLSAPTVSDAIDVNYNNTSSGLTATNIQDAIDEIAAGTGVGAMEYQTVTYDNVNLQMYYGTLDTSAGSPNTDPKSLYLLDSNYKVSLTEGKWLIGYQQGYTQNVSICYLASTLTQDLTTIENNKVTKIFSNDRGVFAGTVIVDVTTPKDYTIWCAPGTSSAAIFYDANLNAVPNPDVVPTICALRLSAPTVGDASAVTYSNVTSGLTATNVQSAIDEVDTRLDSLETEYSVTTINSAADIKTELFALADTNNLTDALQTQIGTNQTNISNIQSAYVTTVNGSSGAITNTNIDHDQLTNFVANEHIDHSSVSIATAATSGIQGGGDLTTTRNLSLNINGMTSDTAATTHEVAVYNGSANRKVTVNSILDSRINYVKFGYSKLLANYAGNTYDATDWFTLPTGPVANNTWIDITQYEDTNVVGTNLSLNGTTGVVTVNVTGHYIFSLQAIMFIDGATNAGLIEVGLNVNSTTPPDGSVYIVGMGENGGSNNGSNCAIINHTSPYLWNATDTIKLQTRWINPTGTRDIRVGFMKVSIVRL